MTATERFKKLLADALERVCVLEEQLEILQAQVDEPRPNVATENERA